MRGRMTMMVDAGEFKGQEVEEQFDIGRWIVITLSLSLSNVRVWH